MTRLLLDAARFPWGEKGAAVSGEGGAAAPPPLVLSGPDHHYLTRVLRHRLGDVLRVGDGQGRWARARLTAIDAQTATLQLEALEPERAEGPQVTLFMALLKGDKLDLVVQKAVELGVARLVPLRCARSVARPDEERARGRLQRWQRIARGAAQQCGRALAPEIAAISDLESVLAEPSQATLRLLPYEGAVWRPLRDLLPQASESAALLGGDPGAARLSIDVLVGPEGGFAAEEVAAASAAGFLPCGLGPRILRAETAAIAALAILSALLE